MIPIFTALASRWKVISAFVIVTIIFLSGYYFRSLQDEVKIKKQLDSEISKANDKLLYNNKIDMIYNKTIDTINIDNEKYGLAEISNEKNAHCTIPTEWVHSLNAISR